MSEKKELEESHNLLLQFEKRDGLLPVIVQEYSTGLILMLGYANKHALDTTLKTELATFWSTSRKSLWTKGETSGDYLRVKEILIDCDQDALIYKVETVGTGVCHTKNKQNISRKTCFYRRVDFNTLDLEKIEEFK